MGMLLMPTAVKGLLDYKCNGGNLFPFCFFLIIKINSSAEKCQVCDISRFLAR